MGCVPSVRLSLLWPGTLIRQRRSVEASTTGCGSAYTGVVYMIDGHLITVEHVDRLGEN
jgi:hypothetical protein